MAVEVQVLVNSKVAFRMVVVQEVVVAAVWVVGLVRVLVVKWD